MKRIVLFLFLTMMSVMIFAEGTDETVYVKDGGELSSILLDLETTSIRSLTITGKLNYKDILYIRSGAGTLNNLEELNLEDVTLEPGGDPYFGGNLAQLRTRTRADGEAYSHYYIISDENRTDTTTRLNMLGYYDIGVFHYNNYLAGAFAGLGLKKVTLPKYITRIGHGTFYGCGQLEEVVMPDNITIVEEGAFGYCRGVQHVNLPETVTYIGNEAFAYCSSLVSAGNLNNVTHIGAEAFEGCKKLTEDQEGNVLNLPNVASIGKYAFSSCEALKTVKVSSNLTHIGKSAFGGCKSLVNMENIPNDFMVVYYSSFSGTPFYNNLETEDNIIYLGKVAMGLKNQLTSPTTLTFREGTTVIADEFNGWIRQEKSNLTGITLPPSLRKIGAEAFGGGYDKEGAAIETIKLPEGLEEIGYQAFKFNKSLVKLEFPSSLKKIGYEAFSGSGLMKVSIPESVEYIGYMAFYNCPALQRVEYYAKAVEDGIQMFLNCQWLDKVVIGAKVKKIPYEMFAGTGITQLEFEKRPSSEPLEIMDGAFSSCNLASLELPEGTVTIREGAFKFCSQLSTAILPSTLDYLDECVFCSCDNIQSIYIYRPTPPEGGLGLDYAVRKNCTLYVPYGSSALYKESKNWEDFSNILEFDAGSVATKQSFEDQGAIFETQSSSTVAITDNKDVKGEYVIPETVNYNGSDYSVTTIGAGAFMGNTELTEVTIPGTVSEIGESAFSGCSNLSVIYSFPVSAVSFVKARQAGTRADGVESVFEGVNKETCMVYVPVGSVESYRNSDLWKDFKSILEMGSTGISTPGADCRSFDVYDLSGRRVRANATSCSGLAKGIYAVNGKKIVNR